MQQADAFLTTRTEKETAYVGEQLGRILDGPITVALLGELGAGKTVFVRGAARGLGITENITSPTFVLLKIYQGRLPLYHFDFYRLSATEDPGQLGFDEYLPGDGVAFVEWAGRLPRLIPAERLQITIERFYDQKGEGRRICFSPAGLTASRITAVIIESLSWRPNGDLNIPQAGEAG